MVEQVTCRESSVKILSKSEAYLIYHDNYPVRKSHKHGKTNKKAKSTHRRAIIKLTECKLAKTSSTLLAMHHSPWWTWRNFLKSMEDRIIAKLSVQHATDGATIDRHNPTTQHMETSLNDMETRVALLESIWTALTKENKALKLKMDNLENRSRHNNIQRT